MNTHTTTHSIQIDVSRLYFEEDGKLLRKELRITLRIKRSDIIKSFRYYQIKMKKDFFLFVRINP